MSFGERGWVHKQLWKIPIWLSGVQKVSYISLSTTSICTDAKNWSNNFFKQHHFSCARSSTSSPFDPTTSESRGIRRSDSWVFNSDNRTDSSMISSSHNLSSRHSSCRRYWQNCQQQSVSDWSRVSVSVVLVSDSFQRSRSFHTKSSAFLQNLLPMMLRGLDVHLCVCACWDLPQIFLCVRQLEFKSQCKASANCKQSWKVNLLKRDTFGIAPVCRWSRRDSVIVMLRLWHLPPR